LKQRERDGARTMREQELEMTKGVFGCLTLADLVLN
jgi:hypothetical protein